MRHPFARLRPPPGVGDRLLLDRFVRHRDEAAFAELVRRHGPLVWGVCRRTLPAADAEDAFQATFLVLLRRASRLPAHDSLAPWLFRTAVLTARTARRADRRRRLRVRVGLPAAEPQATDPDPGPREAVDAALLGLSARDRAVVVLCHLQGHTRAEAARRLGVPEGTLSARLSRALGKLRARLGADPLAVLAVAGSAAATAELRAMAVRAGGLYLGGGAVPPAVATITRGVLSMTMFKALTATGLVLLAAAVTGVGVGLRADEPGQPAAAKMADGPPAADEVATIEASLRAAEAALKAQQEKSQKEFQEAAQKVSDAKLKLEALRKKATKPDPTLVLSDDAPSRAMGGAKYMLTEPVEGGEPLVYYAQSTDSLVKLLARTRAALPDRPVRINAMMSSEQDAGSWLVFACKQVGYKQVQYTGPDLSYRAKLAAEPGRVYKQPWGDTERFTYLVSRQSQTVQLPPGVVEYKPAEVDMFSGPLDLTKWK